MEHWALAESCYHLVWPARFSFLEIDSTVHGTVHGLSNIVLLNLSIIVSISLMSVLTSRSPHSFSSMSRSFLLKSAGSILLGLVILSGRVKGKTMERGGWTQMQLLMEREARIWGKKSELYLKLNTKKTGSRVQKEQRGQKAKLQKKTARQSSN